MIYLIDPSQLANRPPCQTKCTILCTVVCDKFCDKVVPLYGIDPTPI